MMRNWLVADTDADGWAAALDGIDHCFAHRRDFAGLMGRAAGTRTQLFVAEGDGCKAVCPIAERSYRGATDVFTPYGFSGFAGAGDLSHLPEAWREFAQGQGYVAGYIMQHPLAMPGHLAGAWAEMSDAGRTLYRVDLTVGEEERLRALSSKKRAQRLRKWLEAASIETDQARLADAFVRLYPDLMSRRGAGSVYRFSDDILRDLVRLPDTVLVGVCDAAGEVTSVAQMGIAPACGEYLFVAAGETSSGDGDGLLWLGLRALADRGAPACNLGGGITEGDGLSDFKRRLGGEPVPIPVLRQIFDAPRYQALCATAGCDPDKTDFFPAYYR